MTRSLKFTKEKNGRKKRKQFDNICHWWIRTVQGCIQQILLQDSTTGSRGPYRMQKICYSITKHYLTVQPIPETTVHAHENLRRLILHPLFSPFRESTTTTSNLKSLSWTTPAEAAEINLEFEGSPWIFLEKILSTFSTLEFPLRKCWDSPRPTKLCVKIRRVFQKIDY